MSARTPRTILTVGKDGQVREVITLPETRSEWLWGHKEIGAHAGRNERWSKRQGVRGMPLSYVSGRPCITKVDLDAWLRSRLSSDGDRMQGEV